MHNRFSYIADVDAAQAHFSYRLGVKTMFGNHVFNPEIILKKVVRHYFDKIDILPLEFASVTLTNGSVFIEQAKLTPSQKLLRSPLAKLYTRIARWPTFKWQIRKILARPVDEAELSAMWRGMQLGDGLRALPSTIRYIDERYRFYRRWIDPLRDLEVPAMVLWGRRDPVAVEGIGERLGQTIPNAKRVWFDDCGHFPMLEDPARFAETMAEFIEEA